jgi:hypothetical protein
VSGFSRTVIARATRRHFDVVAESLRDDIRIIAEGFAALDAKVERIRDSGKRWRTSLRH